MMKLLLLALAAASATAAELHYRFTIRDFMPALCMRESDYAFAWNTSASYAGLPNVVYDSEESLAGIIGGDANFPLFDVGYAPLIRTSLTAEKYCPYWPFMRNGSISAHPDFEMQFAHAQSGVSGCYLGGASQACTSIQSIISPNLMLATSGLPKVAYCSAGPGDRCGFSNATPSKAATSRQSFFSSWYNDAPVYNKRVGYVMTLSDTGGDGNFGFDSDLAPNGGWFPLDGFRATVNQTRFPDPFEAPVWPNNLADLESPSDPSLGRKFLFTSELHTHFEYKGGETIALRGDDDIWVFINGRPAMDLGGLHPPVLATLALDSVAATLNISVGGVYAMDMFHAERHYSQSNFKLSTSLVGACNVASDGRAVPLPPFALSVGATALPGGSVELVSPSAPASAATHAFFNTKQGLSAGFALSFSFTVGSVGLPEGFAVVVTNQPAGLAGLPQATGAGLGYAGLTNSVAVAFDMCADRGGGSVCAAQTVGVHFPESGGGGGAANGPAEQRIFDGVMRSLRIEEEQHEVRIEYMRNPQWLEVYIDGSLYLRQDNFILGDVLGESDSAWLGFTASTGASPASITLTGVALETLPGDLAALDVSEFASEAPVQNVPADGVSQASFTVRVLQDACGVNVTSGGAGSSFAGVFFEVLAEGAETYGDGALTPRVYNATFVDNFDGSYTASIASSVAATFAIAACVGDGCFVDTGLTAGPGLRNVTGPSVGTTNELLRSLDKNPAVRFVPVTAGPTTSPSASPPTNSMTTTSPVSAPSSASFASVLLLMPTTVLLLIL